MESDAATLGKRTGKDAEQNKGTLVSLLGLDGARRELDRLVDEAIAAVDAAGVGAKGDMLARDRALCRHAEELRAAPVSRTSS